MVVLDKPEDRAFVRELARRDRVNVGQVLCAMPGWVREHTSLPPEFDEPWKEAKNVLQ